jgi:HTH-type transcriptional regulator/antitoxin HigA
VASLRTKAAANITAESKAKQRDRTKAPRARARRAPGAAYFALVHRFPLRTIESDDELGRARTVLNELLDRDSLGRDQEDYLDVLGGLIDQYERSQHPLPSVSDLDMLRHFLDSRGVTCTEAARGAGIAVSTLSSILAGKRKMNRNHIESLAQYFCVKPAVFFGSATERA